jgi:predicted RNase H-like HicB family nuclease
MMTNIRSYWSDEDDTWLAETVGIPGTRTHADTEAEARDAAQELATTWAEIEREQPACRLRTSPAG